MKYLASTKSTVGAQIRRGLFILPASQPKPDMDDMTWQQFVEICSTVSVSSASEFDRNGVTPLNPSAVRSVDGTRQYLHTRSIGHTWRRVSSSIISGDLDPVILPKQPNDRMLERQFAVNLLDAKNFVSVQPYSVKAVIGFDPALPIMSVSQLSFTYGQGSGTYQSSTVMDRKHYIGDIATSEPSSTFDYRSSSFTAAAASIFNGRYCIIGRINAYSNSGGTVTRSYMSMPNMYQAAQPPAPETDTNYWALSAFIDMYSTLHIAFLDTHDIESVNLVPDGAGSVRVILPEATISFTM